MKAVNQLYPGNYYLLIKDFHDPHVVIKRGKVNWVIDRLGNNLMRFFLPMAHVLGFSITDTQMFIVIQFHSESIIRKLPRQIKHMKYWLQEKEMEDYLEGKLPGICMENKLDCREGSIHGHLVKKLSNFYHSFTIHYNKQTQREGNLFSRKFQWYLLETIEEIQVTVAQVQSVPVVFDSKQKPFSCKTNSVKNWGKWHEKVICWKKINELFTSVRGGFISLVMTIYNKIKSELINSRDPRLKIPRFYFKENQSLFESLSNKLCQV
jgi:hypothetical protein